MEENTAEVPQNTHPSNSHSDPFTNVLRWVTKILIIIVALAVFHIPLCMVEELAVDRAQRSVEVQKEIVGNILPEKHFYQDWKYNSYKPGDYLFTYATFFLIVFFFTLIAAELITKVNIHIIQYLISACAPILFYLMTLAFSEKIGFTAGYIVSAAVSVAMVTMYAKMFLGKTVPALVMGAIFAASYLLNFVILRMEDFALISGTIVLAIILGVLMILTGKINRKGDSAQ